MYFYIFFLVLDDSGDVNDLVAEEDGDKIENTADEIPKDDQKLSRKKINNTAAVIPIKVSQRNVESLGGFLKYSLIEV